MGRPRRKGQDSPIGSKQKALAEQEEKLRQKMEDLQQLIKDAPARKEQAEKRRKQDLVIRASQPTRRAESPRPIPQTVRLPYMSLSVANSDAVTDQSLVPGLVTIVPTVIAEVAARIRE